MNDETKTTTTRRVVKKTDPKRKSLAAPIEDHGPGVSTEIWYWIGAFPQCSGEGLDVAGINFPKINETVKSGGIGGKTVRIPRVGALIKLNQDKVEQIQDKLSRCVIRFTEPLRPETFTTNDDGDQVRSGHQSDAEDYTQPRRKGYPIRIPTEDQIKTARENGRAIPRYVRATHDEPAARYLFAQRCENQDSPVRGHEYPDTLETAPELIDWPDE